MIKIRTTSGGWEPFVDAVLAIVRRNTVRVSIESEVYWGFCSSGAQSIDIRGHSDVLRAGVFTEQEIKSGVDCFLLNQSDNGRIFDSVMTAPRNQSTERENWEKWRRSSGSPDTEFRLVKAAYLGWQASGDQDWIGEILPSLERTLQYTLSSRHCWDEIHAMIKRPFSIDTWDINYLVPDSLKVDNDSFDDNYAWGIFHGDNSGFYEAAVLLSKLLGRFTFTEKANRWLEVADGIRTRCNPLLFNGKFYSHFHKLNPQTAPEPYESRQLSMSNPMAVNRGFSNQEQSAAIISEYIDRRALHDAFACWFGIDPPFPQGTFREMAPGTCINGGVFPLVGAELAKAALQSGFEEFGLDQLELYRKLIFQESRSYLWYHPDGTPGEPMTGMCAGSGPADAWGSSAMLHAFIEGLCGIMDLGHSFQQVSCSPRWAATEEEDVEVHVGYEASSTAFGYHFRHVRSQDRIVCQISGSPEIVKFHVLLPPGTRPGVVSCGEVEVPFEESSKEGSIYVDFEATSPKDHEFVINYSDKE